MVWEARRHVKKPVKVCGFGGWWQLTPDFLALNGVSYIVVQCPGSEPLFIRTEYVTPDRIPNPQSAIRNERTS